VENNAPGNPQSFHDGAALSHGKTHRTGVAPDYLLLVGVVASEEEVAGASGSFGNPGGMIYPEVSSHASLTLLAAKSDHPEGAAAGSAHCKRLDCLTHLSALGLDSAGATNSRSLVGAELAALLDAYSKLVPQVKGVREGRAVATAVAPSGGVR